MRDKSLQLLRGGLPYKRQKELTNSRFFKAPIKIFIFCIFSPKLKHVSGFIEDYVVRRVNCEIQAVTGFWHLIGNICQISLSVVDQMLL